MIDPNEAGITWTLMPDPREFKDMGDAAEAFANAARIIAEFDREAAQRCYLAAREIAILVVHSWIKREPL